MNVVTAVYSTIFSQLNALLIALTFENWIQRIVICGGLLFSNMLALVLSNFVFTEMSYTAWMTFGISILFFFILIPFYGYMIMAIINEQMEETIQTVSQKDFYQKMFDAM